MSIRLSSAATNFEIFFPFSLSVWIGVAFGDIGEKKKEKEGELLFLLLLLLPPHPLCLVTQNGMGTLAELRKLHSCGNFTKRLWNV